MPKPVKYAQSQIAHSSVYDSASGAHKPPLYGFFSERRDRRLTGHVVTIESPAPVVHAVPLGYDARKSFLLAKSVAPIKRDARRK